MTEFMSGDEIIVYFDGMILHTYPVTIMNVYAIVLTSQSKLDIWADVERVSGSFQHTQDSPVSRFSTSEQDDIDGFHKWFANLQLTKVSENPLEDVKVYEFTVHRRNGEYTSFIYGEYADGWYLYVFDSWYRVENPSIFNIPISPKVDTPLFEYIEPPKAETPIIEEITFASWQEAYVNLLRDYAARSIGVSSCGETSNPPGGSFLVYDIDGDGIPEIIVVDRFHFTTYVAAYSYRNGLISLEADYFYDYGTMFFSLPGNGMGMRSNEGAWNSAAVLVVEGDSLIPEISLRRGEEEGEIWWRVNDEVVTEEEHDVLYYSLFGDWNERIPVPRHHEITDETIHYAIFESGCVE
jgi:hypothetical protein